MKKPLVVMLKRGNGIKVYIGDQVIEITKEQILH